MSNFQGVNLANWSWAASSHLQNPGSFPRPAPRCLGSVRPLSPAGKYKMGSWTCFLARSKCYPPLKLTVCPLKINGWKRKFLLVRPAYFRGQKVSFGGGYNCCFHVHLQLLKFPPSLASQKYLFEVACAQVRSQLQLFQCTRHGWITSSSRGSRLFCTSMVGLLRIYKVLCYTKLGPQHPYIMWCATFLFSYHMKCTAIFSGKVERCLSKSLPSIHFSTCDTLIVHLKHILKLSRHDHRQPPTQHSSAQKAVTFAFQWCSKWHPKIFEEIDMKDVVSQSNCCLSGDLCTRTQIQPFQIQNVWVLKLFTYFLCTLPMANENCCEFMLS